MSIFDLAIIGILGLFFISGFYRGFIPSLLNLLGFFASWILSFLTYPILSKKLLSIETLSSLRFYIEGREKVNNPEAARMLVSSLSGPDITNIMENANIPSVFVDPIQKNIMKQAFANDGLTTVGEYFNESIFALLINIVAFIGVFIIFKCLFTLLTNAYSYSMSLPQLRHGDHLAGGIVSLVRGFLFMHIIFMIIPITLTIVPSSIAELLSTVTSSIFYSGSILLPLIPAAI